MISRSLRTVAVACTLTLAACSGGSDEAPAPANVEQEAPLVENMGFENMVVPVSPSDTPSPTPAPSPTGTPTPIALDEQMREDADAVGMTARVDRTEAATEETQPAEAERKQP